MVVKTGFSVSLYYHQRVLYACACVRVCVFIWHDQVAANDRSPSRRHTNQYQQAHETKRQKQKLTTTKKKRTRRKKTNTHYHDTDNK